jgi:nicotinamidase-related amidase
MDVRLSSTALLFVETQNEFMHPAGAFHEPILPVTRRNGCFGNLLELARRARGQILLAYAPISFAPGHPELAGRCGILAGVKSSGALERGGFGVRIFSDMQPEPCDLVLETRPGISAFHENGLDATLRERGVRRLAVAGFLTNICVESTVRSAYDYGYEVLVVHDATACNSVEEQTFCETRILPNFAQVISTRDFLTEVGQAVAS